ncbi:MAG: hypothetical protein OH319_01420 [Candidatus Parvarchaeota archaeon]|nr:hypothetical protein [Candidatus Jingweiarchaeum tengchongense]MCW1297770.1 hypothetical protein [Candidatus Jingweiarchaeum tengchongense]MCW1299780.1 hypothetical protein [Candidatus Jingweiarchaeum tengchongense]MCW1304249.1 hypothetical protein [Candidatus Jingweiarchaeum tengchongense]MCW1305277.1 hypothetical protein [Candidatus Jingweiarchaeum tengchongense]
MKRGIESFPFRIYLLILITLLILPILVYQISEFFNLNSKRQIIDDIQVMMNRMNELRATSDQGGFSRVILRVPINSSLIIDNLTNEIRLNYNNEIYVFTPNVQFKNYLFLGTGRYEIVIYYSNTTMNGDNYTVAFI